MSKAKDQYLQSEFPDNFTLDGIEPSVGSILIYIEEKALFGIDEFLKSDTNIELGGVLTGNAYKNSEGNEFVLIKNFIIAKHSSSTLSRLTFTHETWEFINNKIEKDFPEQKILGWFHSHPGHSVFLSGYDLFIQENFFNLPYMIAYVFDPVINDRGFFNWDNGKTVKASGYYIYSDDKKKDDEKVNKLSLEINDRKSVPSEMNSEISQTKNNKVNRNVLLFTMFLFNLLMTFWLFVKVNKLEELRNENSDLKDKLEQLKMDNGKLNTRLDNFIKQLENSSAGKFSESESTYIVKEGDTIKKIAMMIYKDESKAQLLLKANNMKEGTEVKPGQLIQIPKLTE
ncbi:hypothetical protein BH10BAC5_BH10BAC5_29110 [soil metagenome]